MPDINEIQKIVVPIAHFYGVKRLYLFGLYAKGTAGEKSDINLLVEKGKPMSLLQLSGMRQMVQEALNLSVDLVTTAALANLEAIFTANLIGQNKTFIVGKSVLENHIMELVL